MKTEFQSSVMITSTLRRLVLVLINYMYLGTVNFKHISFLFYFLFTIWKV